VGKHQPLFELWGGEDDLPPSALLNCVVLAQERTLEQDLQFGFRQLADIAVRALSPGINDPTTARTALHHTADLLVRLSRRGPAPEAYRDDDGRLRLVINRASWDDVISDALQEIAHYGADSPLLSQDLRSVLSRLEESLPAEAQPALRQVARAGDLLPSEEGAARLRQV
jgi:uncharacterized membrane protein